MIDDDPFGDPRDDEAVFSAIRTYAGTAQRRPTHSTCHHRMYGLGCADFDRMIERAGDLCEICRNPPSTPVRGLQIDHDHNAMIVRGLLCPKCNTHLALVESGKRQPTQDDSRYLANPFEKPEGEQ